jgi:hypothetical protein
MKTDVHVWYLAAFFSEEKCFGQSCTKDQNTYFIFNNLFWKSYRFRDNVEEYGTARQATDANIIRRMRFAWWVTKATHTRSMQ